MQINTWNKQTMFQQTKTKHENKKQLLKSLAKRKHYANKQHYIKQQTALSKQALYIALSKQALYTALYTTALK